MNNSGKMNESCGCTFGHAGYTIGHTRNCPFVTTLPDTTMSDNKCQCGRELTIDTGDGIFECELRRNHIGHDSKFIAARTAEPKCGICLSSPAEADGCCAECRAASEPALQKWQNHEDGQTIARLTAELEAFRTRIEKMNEVLKRCREAIAGVTEEAFGYGVGRDDFGTYHWPIRDELLTEIDEVLPKESGAPEEGESK